MLKQENINGLLFVTETTFYIYGSEKNKSDGKKPYFKTLDEELFNKYREDNIKKERGKIISYWLDKNPKSVISYLAMEYHNYKFLKKIKAEINKNKGIC